MKVYQKDLRIDDQIMILVLPLLLVLLVIVGLFLYSYQRVSDIDASTQKSQLAALGAETLLREMNRMSSSAECYAFTGKADFRNDYETASQSTLQELVILNNLGSHFTSGPSQLDTIQMGVGSWKSETGDPSIESVNNGHASDASKIILKGSHQFAGIIKEIASFRDASLSAAAASRNSSHRFLHWAVLRAVMLAVLYVVLLLVLWRVHRHGLTKPILQLIQASDDLRHGNFDPSLPSETTNEFGVLSRSFLQMAQSLRQDREELAAITHFSEVITECASEKEVYEQILHALCDRFHPRQVIIFKLRPEEDLLEAVVTLLPLPEDLQGWPVIEGKRSCKAVRMGRPFRLNDVTVEPLCPGKFALPTEGSYYCGPLIAGGIIIGTVRLENEPGFWTPERESLLESYLSISASALSTLQLLQNMSEQANIDPLTGLYNRRFCMDYARKMMAMARRKNTPLGFIMLDLDHFKNVNDVFGHEVGDRILKLFAKTVTQSMRETNLTARLGGEEFLILLPETGREACLGVAERIRKAILNMNMPQVSEKPLPQTTVSQGIAVYPEHGASLEEMLLASDSALYESKRGGRNRTTLYVAGEQLMT